VTGHPRNGARCRSSCSWPGPRAIELAVFSHELEKCRSTDSRNSIQCRQHVEGMEEEPLLASSDSTQHYSGGDVRPANVQHLLPAHLSTERGKWIALCATTAACSLASGPVASWPTLEPLLLDAGAPSPALVAKCTHTRSAQKCVFLCEGCSCVRACLQHAVQRRVPQRARQRAELHVVPRASALEMPCLSCRGVEKRWCARQLGRRVQYIHGCVTECQRCLCVCVCTRLDPEHTCTCAYTSASVMRYWKRVRNQDGSTGEREREKERERKSARARARERESEKARESARESERERARARESERERERERARARERERARDR